MRTARFACLIIITFAGAGCSEGDNSDTAAAISEIADGATQARSYVSDDVNYGAVERYYLLHLPKGMVQDQPYPLIFVFHGTGGDAYSTETASWFSEVSDESGLIVVYPQALGIPRNQDTGIDSTLAGTRDAPAGWNTRPAASNYGAINDIDDTGYIAQLYESLAREFPVDQNRVYSTGLSNGCGFTTVLMARLNESLAATAQNACGMYPVDVVPEGLRKIPFMVLHGTDDDVVPYDGSEGTAVPGDRTPLPETIESCADFYECEGKRVTREDNIERWDYEGCVSDLAFVTIHGGEHRWYSWQARMIRDFFVGHPLD